YRRLVPCRRRSRRLGRPRPRSAVARPPPARGAPAGTRDRGSASGRGHEGASPAEVPRSPCPPVQRTTTPAWRPRKRSARAQSADRRMSDITTSPLSVPLSIRRARLGRAEGSDGMARITINGVSLDPLAQAPALAAAGLDTPDTSASNYILVQTA